jgi:hypothetical protein
LSQASRGPVVIDTGVFGARLTPSGRLLASHYRPLLEGRPAVISFITVAELGFGCALAVKPLVDLGLWKCRSAALARPGR